MMIIEIWLKVLAWRKGWKGYALLPVGVSFSLAFLTGIVVSLSDGSVDRLWSVGILLDVCAIVALIMMVNRQPGMAQALQVMENSTGMNKNQPQLSTIPVPKTS
jgi:hypothetical protein